MKIVLCGIKHCGKTTLGRALAALRRVSFADTDELLARLGAARLGGPHSVRELFRTLGEERFRRWEAEALQAAAQQTEPVVLALGGGALENPFVSPEVRERLGYPVWVEIPDETAFARMLPEGLPPFLASAPDPLLEFRRRNALRRREFAEYAALQFCPEPDESPEQAAEKLNRLLPEEEDKKR